MLNGFCIDCKYFECIFCSDVICTKNGTIDVKEQENSFCDDYEEKI